MMFERWFFYQDVASLWKWARLDVYGTVLSYSSAAFGTRHACVDDARRNGYQEDRYPAADLPAMPADPVTASARAHNSRF